MSLRIPGYETSHTHTLSPPPLLLSYIGILLDRKTTIYMLAWLLGWVLARTTIYIIDTFYLHTLSSIVSFAWIQLQ